MSGEVNKPALRIGMLRLADAAPVVVASEQGLFARHGLRAALQVEASWANILDKLAYGLLDAAVILPPLAIAAAAGLRGPRTGLIVPMTLSQGGNGIALSEAVADRLALAPGADMMARGAALRRHVASLAGDGRRLRLGIVHVFSGHNLLLRYWLAASGIDPDVEVELVVVPPAQMPEALAAGHLDGFVAGAPWAPYAAHLGIGRVLGFTDEIWPRHPEKALAVRADWAEAAPDRLAALLRALRDAAAMCDVPAHADAVAALLGGDRLLPVPPALIRRSFPGEDGLPGRIGFLRNGATVPSLAHEAWFAAQMGRWGWLGSSAAYNAPIYRPDLYRTAVGAEDPVPDDEPLCDGCRIDGSIRG